MLVYTLVWIAGFYVAANFKLQEHVPITIRIGDDIMTHGGHVLQMAP